jgi:hypothetical protein
MNLNTFGITGDEYFDVKPLIHCRRFGNRCGGVNVL